MSSPQPFSAVIESFSDTVTEMLHEATELTRVSAQAYLEGLNALVDQQKLARDGALEWMSASSEVTEGAVTDAAVDPLPRAAASPKRTRTAPSRRTRRPARTPAATAALSTTVGAGLATWTSEGYDSLTAAEVLDKLPGFSQRDLREVDTYEKSHQARQTVLQRIDSLRGLEPVPGYDELTVPEVQAQLTAGDGERAKAVRDYERSHKKRDGVLHAAQAHLDKA